MNFVAGMVPSLPSACTNASGVSASFTSDTTLELGVASQSPTSSGTATGPTTSPTEKSGAVSELANTKGSSGLLLGACVVFFAGLV